MWILVLLTLINGVLPNDVLINTLSTPVAGVPINFLDWCLFLAVFVVVGYPKLLRLPVDRAHPVLWPLTGLFFAAIVLSSFKSFTGQYQVDPSWYMKTVRHYAALPAAIVLGYYLLPNQRAAKFFAYVLIFAGLATAIMIILFFRGKGQEMSGMEIKGVNALRTIDYATSYATIATSLLIFSILSGIRLMPTVLAYLIAGICLVGIFVTLTRSEWVAAASGLVSVLFLIPRERRSGLVLKASIAGSILLAFLWASIQATSAITQSDFAAKINERIMSMLPGAQENPGLKAWDTRTAGIMMELEMFAKSPVAGQGFGSQYAQFYLTGGIVIMRHNAFTSIMAESGLLGLVPVLIAFGAMGTLGRRTVLAQVDKGTMLIGAVGYICAFHFPVLGMATMSFNNERLGIVLGIACGMTIRARDMQLALTRASWQGHLPGHFEVLRDEHSLPHDVAVSGY